MDQERVIAIPGHPGYFVSDQGKVFSAWCGSGRGARIGSDLKPMRITIAQDGRAQVNLRRKTYRVAILVLTAFVGPRPAGMQACHFPDSTPANNRLENLRWDTPEANQGRDKEMHGTSNAGERNGSARLTVDQVIIARARAAAGESQSKLATEFGVSRSAIQQAVSRTTWKKVA